MRRAVKIDAKTDWRGGMLEAARQRSTPALRASIESALAHGVDVDTVRQFLGEQRGSVDVGAVADLFGRPDESRRATDRLLDQTAHRPTAPSTSATSTSTSLRPMRAHTVRLDPAAALAWFHRVPLPALPAPFPVGGVEGAVDVVVQGERFSPASLAALLGGR